MAKTAFQAISELEEAVKRVLKEAYATSVAIAKECVPNGPSEGTVWLRWFSSLQALSHSGSHPYSPLLASFEEI